MEEGGPPQPADSDISDAASRTQLPDPQQHHHHHLQKPLLLPATPSYGGRFIQYNVSANIFEVTAKYKNPVMAVGEGAYGFVCSAFNIETNENVAIKKIANAFDEKIDVKRILREIQLLRHMSHENVVAIRDVIPPPQRECFTDVYIVYELMDTNMHRLLRSGQQFVTEHYQYFLYQILRGLKYIHSSNVLHMDLKPSNLLLSAECDLKICDFRQACLTSESDLMLERGLTIWYGSPELLSASSYTAATDIWSVGCIFMELINRKPLFPGKDHLNQLRLLLELVGTPSEAEIELLHESPKNCIRQLPRYPRQSFAKKFPNVNPLAIDLAEKMLRFDPRQRITVEDALAHPYLTTLHDESDEPVSMIPFKFQFKRGKLTKEKMKELIYQEALAFNPYHQ